MSFPAILHHGARTGVTGSCHELRMDEKAGILIDCGLFQGDESSEGAGPEIDFPIDHIEALLLTHVHIDHAGRIPYLLAAGFEGPILCSEPSALMLPLVLEDALKIGITRDPRLIELFLFRIEKQLVPLPYGKWHRVRTGGATRLDVKLQRAGHILGSAFVECKISKGVKGDELAVMGEKTELPASHLLQGADGDFRVVFSGDLGAPYAPLLPAPRSPYRADMLVLESTYGDRVHEGRRERRSKLRQVVELALKNRGTVLVPAFSLGRTQELLYELEEIIHRRAGRPAAAGLPWDELEVIVDSPLASRFTEAYKKLRPYWDAEAGRKVRSGRHPLSFEQLTCIDSHRDHLYTVAYLKRTARPCVVVAASGMCAGGRIIDYLKALVGDACTDLLFVGYQASGTPGRAIQKYGPGGGYVVLDGSRYAIRARVHTIGGYSAHADQRNLVNFVRRMRHRPKVVRLVHGEADAKKELGRSLAEAVSGLRVEIPE